MHRKLGVFVAVVGGLSTMVAACGMVEDRPTDSETHFLGACESECASELSSCAGSMLEDSGDLACIGGVVTRTCDGDAGCVNLGPAARCRLLAGTGGGSFVCDVACVTSSDCASLSPEHACEAGWCRWRPAGSVVGQFCLPEDEMRADFSGYGVHEINILNERDDCAGPDICLVNHFQGRVSCPYGQTAEQAAAAPRCVLLGTSEPVTVEVPPQLVERRSSDTVYCSCRCDGPAGSGDFCTCPSGFACVHLVEQLSDSTEYAGSYCVKEGTVWDGSQPTTTCDPELANCQ